MDIVSSKVEQIKQPKSPIQNGYIEKYLGEKRMDFTAMLDSKMGYSAEDFVAFAVPTNYDSVTQYFNTRTVEAVIDLVMEYSPEAT